MGNIIQQYVLYVLRKEIPKPRTLNEKKIIIKMKRKGKIEKRIHCGLLRGNKSFAGHVAGLTRTNLVLRQLKMRVS